MNLKDKIIKYSMLIMFILLPIIDCIRRTTIKDVEILGISIIEIINIIIICYTLLLTIFSIKDRKKELLPIIIYSVILLIYVCFHNYHIINFDHNIYEKNEINIVTETFYIFRVYYMPVLLLFVLNKNKKIFDLKFYSKLIKSLICIIGISIILLNVFKLSYATYAETNNEFVKYNIFDFYKSSESPKQLSTRGWFDSANEISAILMMLMPLNIFLLYKENKKNNTFIYIVQFIAMIILGTRVSSLGAIIITVCAIIINILAKLINKAKMNYKFILCGLLCAGYFFVSPVGKHLLNYSIPNFTTNDEHSAKIREIKNDKELSEYINNNLYDLRINEAFVKMYPIENDIIFWKQIALRNRNLNNDSRIMKITIIKRIKERNNNKYDTLLGMGYTLNFQDLERDYVYQYYLFGVLGIILIIPQLTLFIKIGLSYLTKIKNLKKLNIINLLLTIMSPTLGLAVAYFSGHVFGWISPSYILILTLSVLNYINQERKLNYEK